MDPIEGYDALVDVCRGALEPLDASQHLLGNLTVELDGDGAECECYLHAQHVRRRHGGRRQYVVAGTYATPCGETPTGG